MKVIKKDGRVQDFDKKKIATAVMRSGEKKHAGKIADAVERKLRGKKEVLTSVIRGEVIRQLHKCEGCKADDFAKFQKAIRNMSSMDDFLENRIRDLVGSCGKVEGVYGGFRIIVSREKDFDFYGVLVEILGSSRFTVSVELRDSLLVINAR